MYNAPLIPGTGTSKVIQNSICFGISIAANASTTHVGFAEEWKNGAIYWHLYPIKSYRLTPNHAFDQQTADFQKHISNILDWGLGDRRNRIFEGAAEA